MPILRFAKAAFELVAGTARWFFDLIYGSVPAEFESSFDMDESVRRLAAFARWFAFTSREAVAEGDVEKGFVSIRRPYFVTSRLDYRNGFEPFFKGEFCEVDGRVVLSGRFTLGLFAKVFATVWFGAVVVWIVATTWVDLMGGNARTWWFPFAGAGFFAIGLANVVVGKRCARSDIPWLSQLIQNALSGKAVVGANQGRSLDRLPMVSDPEGLAP